jgi:hypothetical protein
LGCPAEQLGLELPPSGATSISAEDVQRDVRGVLREGVSFYALRMRQMGFEVREGPGWTCGVRGQGGTRGWRAPLPTSTDSATAAAVLIGMAKAWDTTGGPPGERWLCLGTGAPAAVWTDLGWFGPGSVERGPPVHAGAPDPARPVERLDFRALARQAGEVFALD